jgi:hypothetical protein
MAEVLEYSLVFLLSLVMAGSSILISSSFISDSRGLQNRAAFSGLTDAAWRAVEQGNADDSITLATATISCTDGNMSLSSPYYSASVSLPVGCDFGFPQVEGTRQIEFSFSNGRLGLEVV